MKIISREFAQARHMPRYATGVPCCHGHIAERYTSGGQCVQCAIDRNIRRRTDNPEKEKARYRSYREQNRAKRRAAGVIYDANHKEERKAYEATHKKDRKAYREKHGERRRLRMRKYREEHPEIKANQKRRRRAMKKGALGKHTAQDIQRLLEEQEYMCVYCSANLKRRKHIDHIMPLCRGGSDGPENLQILCPECNIDKGTRDPIEYEASIGYLRPIQARAARPGPSPALTIDGLGLTREVIMSFDKCPKCGRYDFLDRHRCLPEWLALRAPEWLALRAEYGDGVLGRAFAHNAEFAAENYAEEHFSDWEYPVEMEIWVKRVGYLEWQKFLVTVEPAPVFSATPIKSEPERTEPGPGAAGGFAGR